MKALTCDYCSVDFEVTPRKWTMARCDKARGSNIYCSKNCRDLALNRHPKVLVDCKYCNKSFKKRYYEYKVIDNHFCSRSCAATYNNTHKTKGTRRSKLEVWLEDELKVIYPELEILYCDKTTINSELDIYIPSLNLAFELNGIFHYEPIFGESKLDQIQNNDNRKFQACIEHGIELCIIDTSQHKYVKPSTSQKYLDIILKIINLKS